MPSMCHFLLLAAITEHRAHWLLSHRSCRFLGVTRRTVTASCSDEPIRQWRLAIERAVHLALDISGRILDFPFRLACLSLVLEILLAGNLP